MCPAGRCLCYQYDQKKGAIAPLVKVLANAPLAKHLFFGCLMEALDFVHV